MSNEKVEFAIKILREYAKESGNMLRGTTDISPLEEWLILRLFDSNKSLPYDVLVAIGEACVFMQGYKGTCTKEGEWSDFDEQGIKTLKPKKMNTDKTALTAAKDFLKGKTMRVSNANLKEPPGGTYRAVHENEVADLLTEFSSQQNKELIEENEKLESELSETGIITRERDELQSQLQESHKLNERLVDGIKYAAKEFDFNNLQSQFLAMKELLSSTKENTKFNLNKTK